MANEVRLIDANALMDEFRNYMVERYDKEKCVSEENCKTCENSCLWRKMVMSAPTVDAVEVVRCKDCKYAYINSFSAASGVAVCKKWSNEAETAIRQHDDFCSYGERREGE